MGATASPVYVVRRTLTCRRERRSYDTRDHAPEAGERFAEEFESKYPKAAECLRADQDQLFVHFDFPAEHWKHLRATDIIESPFSTVRLRQRVTKGAGSRAKAFLMAFKLSVLLRAPEKRRRAVVEGLRARDIKSGEELERFLDRLTEQTLKEVYRRSLPLQLTMMLEAPELLVVCYKVKPLAECRSLFDLNPLASVWMCIENIVLATTAEGLFACTYTPYDAESLMKVLGVPAGWQVAALIPFGYPRTPPNPVEAEDLDSRLHVDAW